MRLTLILWLALLFAPLNSMALATEGKIKNVSAQALKRVNDYRTANGLGRVKMNKKLTAAAALHARSMMKYGFFSHEGPGKSSPGSRARSQGYRYCRIAENIAKGQRSMDEVITAWINSPGHRRNILDRDVNEFSLVWGPGNIWVMELGRQGC